MKSKLNSMTLDNYQTESRKTAIYPDIDSNIIYPVLGLCGESGELAEKIKKAIRDDGGKITDTRRTDIIKELGDVMWYMAAIASELKISLDTVARTNLDKLNSRKNRGKLGGSGDER